VKTFEQAEARVFARYGVTFTSRFVRLREPRLRVRVLECGEGPPLLLIGGDGAVAAAWAPLAAQMAGRRVILLDRPGFGLSDAFDYRGTDMRRHGAGLLGSLLDALELESASLVGSSGGGQWALWLALAAPERVRSLALMGIPAVCLPGFRPAGLRIASIPGLGRLVFALPSPSPRVTGRMLAGADARLLEHPELVELYHEARRMRDFGRTASAIFRATMRVGGAARPRYVLADDELAGVEPPVLFVWGEREPFGDVAVAERAAALMPRARVELIPDAWHHPWLADPPRVGQLVSAFLVSTELAHDSP
jgi:pimeloyl-[acyl-carrier protein] methyl ester esterase